MDKVPVDILNKSLSFTEFIEVGERNLNENFRAFNEMYLQYSQLSLVRSKRVLKTTNLLPDTTKVLQDLTQKQIWLVLSESWCGDAAHTVPIMQKMTEVSDKIELSLLFRDENLDFMDHFLTNGGRSIPKLIIMDENRTVLATWGPRPVECQKMYENAVKEKPFEEVLEMLQKWYNADKSISTQKELMELVLKVEKLSIKTKV